MDQIWPSEKKVSNFKSHTKKSGVGKNIHRVGRQPGDPTSRDNKHRHKYELAKAKHWWINMCPWSTLYASGLSCVRLLYTTWTAAHQLPCASPNPRACSNSCPLSRWCHPSISSSVAPFTSCPQSFPASGSFLNPKQCENNQYSDSSRKTSFLFFFFKYLCIWLLQVLVAACGI